jgi:thiosulfate sulfurtransferase
MSWQSIPAAQAANMLSNPDRFAEIALFDSRDMQSFQKGHIPGADQLSEYKLDQVLRSLPRNIPVMIYCYHGNASKTFAQMFEDFRYREVYSVEGGYEALAPLMQPLPERMAHAA